MGDFIRLVDVRNTDLKVTELLRINIDKYFMPSVANVVGNKYGEFKEVVQMIFFAL